MSSSLKNAFTNWTERFEGNALWPEDFSGCLVLASF